MKITSTNQNSLGAKLFLVLFFSFFLLIGSVVFVIMAKSFYQDTRSFFWDEGVCQIIDARIQTKLSEEKPFLVNISYQLVKYQKIGNSTLPINGNRNQSYSNFKDAYSLFDRFPNNSTVPCYYESNNPGLNVLLRGNPAKFLILLFPAIFIVIGICGILAGVINFKKSSASRVSKKLGPISWKIKLLLTLPILAGIIASSYYLIIKPYGNVISSKNWSLQSAEVVKSEVRSSESDDGTTYSPNIIFKYNLGGRSYYSDQRSFFEYSSSGYSRSQQIVEKYPVGQKIQILVDPHQPINAVIEPTVPSLLFLFALIPLGLILILYALLKSIKVIPPLHRTDPKLDSIISLDWLPNKVLQQQSGSKNFILIPDISRGSKFIGITIFALVWNGVVCVMWGEAPWIMTIIFGVIGLVLIYAMFHCFLQLFNPKLLVEIDAHPLSPGREYKIYWRLDRTKRQIEGITIDFELEERATYRRGTDTTTDKKVIYTQNLYKQSGRSRERQGEALLKLPNDLIHSFNAPNNKLVYNLKFVIQVANYPDLKEIFELVVSPK